MAKKFNIKDTELYRRTLGLSLNDAWPFATVTADTFIQSSSELLELRHNVTDRKVDNKRVSPEAYMDRTACATAFMLQCIRKMELEVTTQEMKSMTDSRQNNEYNMSFLDGCELVEYAVRIMCDCNNVICDYLEPDLKKNGIEPQYIDMENEGNYLVDQDCEFAEQTAKSHYEAVKAAYDEIDNLITHGLPAESAVGKFIDRIVGNAEIKNDNRAIIDQILNSEANLDVINLYILPELKLKIQECEAQAKIEEANTKELSEMAVGELRQTNPYFFRNEYQRHVDALDSIERTLLIMQKKEFKLESDYQFIVDRDQKTSTYVFTAKWASGDKNVRSESQQLSDNVTHKSTIVKLKNRKEKSIEFKVGRSSKRLYEETKKRSACKLGYINQQELKIKDKYFINTLAAHSRRKVAMWHRKTKADGSKSTYDSKFSIDIAKAENTIVHKYKDKNGEEKQQEIVSASAQIGSVSANASTKNGIPIAGASIEAVGANASAFGVLKAQTSFGAIECTPKSIASQELKKGKIGEVVEKLLPKNSENTEQSTLFPPNGSEMVIGESELEVMSNDMVDMNIFDQSQRCEVFKDPIIYDIVNAHIDRDGF